MRQPTVLGQVARHGPQRVHVVGADRAPSIARSTMIIAARSMPDSNDRISARRPAATTRSDAVSVSSSARWSAISRASRAGQQAPSFLAGSSEEPKGASWEVDEEPPVQEPVGPLA